MKKNCKPSDFFFSQINYFLDLHNDKLSVESTSKNRHTRVLKKIDTQTCEIHTHACRFINIFLPRHPEFFRTHARV
jgi:hypothetical protein